MRGAGGADYGKTCNARFWPEPHELVCERPPGHEGEHSAMPGVNGDGTLNSRAIVRSGPATAAERFEILRWAGARPGVLALLAALREHNYDETGTEQLRRIVGAVVRTPPGGRALAQVPSDRCANCGLDIAVGKHVARGVEGMCEIPVEGSEPRRATTIVR